MTKIPAKVLSLLQEQLTTERHANAVYLAIAASLSQTAFHGFTEWFEVQGHEEYLHFKKVFAYLVERNEMPEIGSTENVSIDVKEPLEAMRQALALEVSVTESINAICEAADEEGDESTEEFLLWFIREQRESEKKIQEWILKLELAGKDACALLKLDEEADDEADCLGECEEHEE